MVAAEATAARENFMMQMRLCAVERGGFDVFYMMLDREGVVDERRLDWVWLRRR